MSKIDDGDLWESVVKAAFMENGARIAAVAAVAACAAVGTAGGASASVNAADILSAPVVSSSAKTTEVKQADSLRSRKFIRTARALGGRP